MSPLFRSFPATGFRPGGPGLLALAIFILALVSCTSRHSPMRNPAPATTPAFVPVETRIGVIRVIGPEGRFVLIETPSALATSALSEGQLLHCRPPDALTHTSTADLRVSRERHQALVVADVVAGEPMIGAVVFSTPHASPAATPPADSISSVATAPLPGLFMPHKP